MGIKNCILIAFFSGLIWFLSSCSENKSKRYFFIGYYINNQSQTIVGNFYSIGEIKNVDYYQLIIFNNLRCEYPITIDQCIITSIYEFKDSLEYAQFKNGRIEPIKECDSSQNKIVFFIQE